MLNNNEIGVITPNMDLGVASPMEYNSMNESGKKKRRVVMTESQIEFIKKNKGKLNEETVENHGFYKLDNLEKLMEYMRIDPQKSGLKMTIFVDDSKSYIQDGHPLLMFVVNGYDNDTGGYIPFVVCEHPYVMDDDSDMEYQVEYDDLFDVQDFIQVNLKGLVGLANEKISQKEFWDSVKSVQKYALCKVCEEKQ